MKIKESAAKEYDPIVRAIAEMIHERGLKAATMDYVASRLSMSKRTLYEIFGSKNNMVMEALGYIHTRHIEMIREAFKTSPTVLEAWIKVIRHHFGMMASTNANFFRDMDHYFKEIRGVYDRWEDDRNREIMKICSLGVDQGVFRPDVNYAVQTRMMEIQMESLKRMEELFPPDISLAEAYKAICIGFLRSVVTPQGMGMLDALTADFSVLDN